jgi:hypothetical protein
MDKRKLVNIILKDLEEVRLLTEEVAESQDASLIEVELAFNRAKLLVQELELLRELAGGPTVVPYHSDGEKEEVKAKAKVEEEDVNDQVEEDFNYPEPELEIINYEEDEFSGNEELDEDDDETNDFIDEEDNESEAEQEEELTKELEEVEEPDLDEEEMEEEDWDDEEEDDIVDDLEEEDQEPEFEEVKNQPTPNIHSTELKSGPQEGFREINIDDLDDDIEIQPIRATPSMGSTTRPPMREIPKPEDAILENDEKTVLGEKYHKERTLNETLGSNKAADSKLMNGPITSLKAAIGLNDRFLFIREIFSNNSAKYNEVIDNLDKMEQIQEAVEYLKNNLTMKKNEASMMLVDLLKRRFTK